MMPSWLSALFLVGIGSALLVVAYRGYRSGELPAGSRGFHAYRPTREDNPGAFHFFLALYFCSGLLLCAWGLLTLMGAAPALRLH